MLQRLGVRTLRKDRVRADSQLREDEFPEGELTDRGIAGRELPDAERLAHGDLADGAEPRGLLSQPENGPQRPSWPTAMSPKDAWPIARSPAAIRPTATRPFTTTRLPVSGQTPYV